MHTWLAWLLLIEWLGKSEHSSLIYLNNYHWDALKQSSSNQIAKWSWLVNNGELFWRQSSVNANHFLTMAQLKKTLHAQEMPPADEKRGRFFATTMITTTGMCRRRAFIFYYIVQHYFINNTNERELHTIKQHNSRHWNWIKHPIIASFKRQKYKECIT